MRFSVASEKNDALVKLPQIEQQVHQEVRVAHELELAAGLEHAQVDVAQVHDVPNVELGQPRCLEFLHCFVIEKVDIGLKEFCVVLRVVFPENEIHCVLQLVRQDFFPLVAGHSRGLPRAKGPKQGLLHFFEFAKERGQFLYFLDQVFFERVFIARVERVLETLKLGLESPVKLSHSLLEKDSISFEGFKEKFNGFLDDGFGPEMVFRLRVERRRLQKDPAKEARHVKILDFGLSTSVIN